MTLTPPPADRPSKSGDGHAETSGPQNGRDNFRSDRLEPPVAGQSTALPAAFAPSDRFQLCRAGDAGPDVGDATVKTPARVGDSPQVSRITNFMGNLETLGAKQVTGQYAGDTLTVTTDFERGGWLPPPVGVPLPRRVELYDSSYAPHVSVRITPTADHKQLIIDPTGLDGHGTWHGPFRDRDFTSPMVRLQVGEGGAWATSDTPRGRQTQRLGPGNIRGGAVHDLMDPKTMAVVQDGLDALKLLGHSKDLTFNRLGEFKWGAKSSAQAEKLPIGFKADGAIPTTVDALSLDKDLSFTVAATQLDGKTDITISDIKGISLDVTVDASQFKKSITAAESLVPGVLKNIGKFVMPSAATDSFNKMVEALPNGPKTLSVEPTKLVISTNDKGQTTVHFEAKNPLNPNEVIKKDIAIEEIMSKIAEQKVEAARKAKEELDKGWNTFIDKEIAKPGNGFKLDQYAEAVKAADDRKEPLVIIFGSRYDPELAQNAATMREQYHVTPLYVDSEALKPGTEMYKFAQQMIARNQSSQYSQQRQNHQSVCVVCNVGKDENGNYVPGPVIGTDAGRVKNINEGGGSSNYGISQVLVDQITKAKELRASADAARAEAEAKAGPVQSNSASPNGPGGAVPESKRSETEPQRPQTDSGSKSDAPNKTAVDDRKTEEAEARVKAEAKRIAEEEETRARSDRAAAQAASDQATAQATLKKLLESIEQQETVG